MTRNADQAAAAASPTPGKKVQYYECIKCGVMVGPDHEFGDIRLRGPCPSRVCKGKLNRRVTLSPDRWAAKIESDEGYYCGCGCLLPLNVFDNTPTDEEALEGLGGVPGDEDYGLGAEYRATIVVAVIRQCPVCFEDVEVWLKAGNVLVENGVCEVLSVDVSDADVDVIPANRYPSVVAMEENEDDDCDSNYDLGAEAEGYHCVDEWEYNGCYTEDDWLYWFNGDD